MPADMKPIKKRKATVSSGRFFSSVESLVCCTISCGMAMNGTFVDGIDIWSLQPVCCVHEQVDREEAPAQLVKALCVRFGIGPLVDCAFGISDLLD